MSVSNFEKHRLSFTSHQGKIIFGTHFKSGKKAAIQSAAKMLLSDQLTKKGTIDRNKLTYMEDYDLWSYIYYLYSFNNEHIAEFVQMKGEDGQASAEKFYDVVKSSIEHTGLRTQYLIEKLSVIDLVNFIDRVVYKYGDRLKNPVVDHYNQMLAGSYIDFFKNIDIVVRTGRDNARVVRDPRNVANSDIIITIGMRES